MSLRPFCLLALDKRQAVGVDAVAVAGGLGAVGEDVAEVAVASGAEHFESNHAVAAVGAHPHAIRLGGLEERRPACARVELRVAAEKRKFAAGAVVHALLLVVVEDAAEGGLSAM